MKRVLKVFISFAVASAGVSNGVLAQSKASIKILNQFQAHNLTGESLINVHYSPTSTNFITTASDGRVKVWAEPRKLTAEFSHNPPAMLFNGRLETDNKTLVTAAYNGVATRWSTLGTSPQNYGPHLSGVTDVEILPGNDGVITTSDDGSIRFWTIDGRLVKRIERQGVARNLALAKQRKLVAVTQDIGNVTIVSTTGAILQAFKTNQGRLNDVIFSPDEKLVITTGFDGSIKIWALGDLKLSPKLQTTIQASQTGWINGLALNQAGVLASVSDDGRVRLWTLSGKELATLALSDKHLLSCSFSPDGKKLLVATQNGTISELEVNP